MRCAAVKLRRAWGWSLLLDTFDSMPIPALSHPIPASPLHCLTPIPAPNPLHPTPLPCPLPLYTLPCPSPPPPAPYSSPAPLQNPLPCFFHTLVGGAADPHVLSHTVLLCILDITVQQPGMHASAAWSKKEAAMEGAGCALCLHTTLYSPYTLCMVG